MKKLNFYCGRFPVPSAALYRSPWTKEKLPSELGNKVIRMILKGHRCGGLPISLASLEGKVRMFPQAKTLEILRILFMQDFRYSLA